jgi:thymidylate kinase
VISYRTQFLSALFAEFDRAQIPYCISRNAGETFANTGSDVDLVVSPADLKTAARVCTEVAGKNGYRLAMRTRFTNLCLLFWSPTADFVRIDIEPGVRWKLFSMVSASELLADRERADQLFVPSPTGEAMVLAAKVAWMGKLSERYARRLKALHEETGGVSDASEDARKIIDLAWEGNSAGLRRCLIMRTLTRPSRWAVLVASMLYDFKRVLSRILRPPGVHVRFHGGQALDWDALSRYLEMGFPVQKASVFTDGLDTKRAFSSLFRGGIVLEQMLTRESASAPRPSGPAWRMAAGGNRISIFRPGNGKLYLAHEASGLMAELEDLLGQVELQVADFIGEAMAQKHRPVPTTKQGSFIVLVGLDGAGKTTFARNLCARLAGGESGGIVRYFHWIPSLRRRSFPWPSFEETPRKSPAHGALHAMLSVIRLIKNLIHARCVYHLGIRRWVKRGETVIVDRFILNYWLDPVSLRYNGPDWLLALAARLMPQADLVFSLEADADTLLSRKQELTRDEITRQAKLLETLPVDGGRKMVLNAGLDPQAIVSEAMEVLLKAKGA